MSATIVTTSFIRLESQQEYNNTGSGGASCSIGPKSQAVFGLNQCGDFVNQPPIALAHHTGIPIIICDSIWSWRRWG